MTHMVTIGGLDYHFVPPGISGQDIRIEDIAHSLAQINRYTGHARRPYSVAEHSLLVADIAAMADTCPQVQLAALMHDAHEAYTGDVSSPVKQAVGQAWHEFEDAHADAVRDHFDLAPTFAYHQAQIRLFDLQALATERRDISGYQPGRNLPWPVIDTAGHEVLPVAWVQLNHPARNALQWMHWRDEFLRRFVDLRRLVLVKECAA